MSKHCRAVLQEVGMNKQRPVHSCCRAISISETNFWDAFGQWFAVPVCMLMMLKGIVELLCHPQPLSVWSQRDCSQRLMADGWKEVVWEQRGQRSWLIITAMQTMALFWLKLGLTWNLPVAEILKMEVFHNARTRWRRALRSSCWIGFAWWHVCASHLITSPWQENTPFRADVICQHPAGWWRPWREMLDPFHHST